MDWKPWKEFEQDAERLPIEEPPCKYCIYWSPHRDYDKSGIFTGITCCTTPKDIWHDFSCYEAKIFVSE